MPGATETEFFERADMLDTKVGQSKKDDPADVAEIGFEAMMRRRRRRGDRLEEQAARGDRQHRPGRYHGRAASHAGRARIGKEKVGITLPREHRRSAISVQRACARFTSAHP